LAINLLNPLSNSSGSGGNMRYQSGNTIRCEVEFTNFAGEFTDPTTVKFITYDQAYKKLTEVTLTSGNKSEVGKWFYDLTVPTMDSKSKEGVIFYEWYGDINGKPTVKRESLEVCFA
jgi:hypothetical protein